MPMRRQQNEFNARRTNSQETMLLISPGADDTARIVSGALAADADAVRNAAASAFLARRPRVLGPSRAKRRRGFSAARSADFIDIFGALSDALARYFRCGCTSIPRRMIGSPPASTAAPMGAGFERWSAPTITHASDAMSFRCEGDGWKWCLFSSARNAEMCKVFYPPLPHAAASSGTDAPVSRSLAILRVRAAMARCLRHARCGRAELSPAGDVAATARAAAYAHGFEPIRDWRYVRRQHDGRWRHRHRASRRRRNYFPMLASGRQARGERKLLSAVDQRPRWPLPSFRRGAADAELESGRPRPIGERQRAQPARPFARRHISPLVAFVPQSSTARPSFYAA